MPLLIGNVNHLTLNINREQIVSTNSSTVTPTTNTKHATVVSIPAVVGGTAAGIALVVIAVVGWKWFIRQSNKGSHSRKQSITTRQTQTTPDKLNEEGCGPSSSCDDTGCSDGKTSHVDSVPNTVSTASNTTPVQHSLIIAAPLPGPPITPPKNPARALRRPSDQLKESAGRGSRTSFGRASNRLSHKSTISTASVYSTQTEEEQVRVPVATITAALDHTFGTRHLSRLDHSSEPHTIGEQQAELTVPCSTLRHSTHSDANPHRVSNISAGSLCLQQGAQSTDSIGVAYGGEES
ncbi:uncharacterized protein EDB91DRAFT_1241314 [Suillus paluster]|uniref:uncharacterized protein n=1 Tax=Suillus paluster TaxID=48578 RepID=UPI001B87A60D|nr:uncharacterized protein EDB91DRAFT_1241314 [Suillus paluster]KAG1756214.1 hypothetical protein EDB91DRAFT_1241314 [Suillus paluster]